MSEEIKLSPKEEERLKRAQECTRLLFDCAELNNFLPHEFLFSIEEIFINLMISSDAGKERIENTIDELKKVIFKELDNNIKSCQKNQN